MIKTILKTTILAGLMTTMIGVGEYYQPYNKVKNKIKFYNVPAAEDTPTDYLNWKTKIEIKDGKAELYLGNGIKYKRVHENGNVGSLGESIDEFIDKFTSKTKETIEDNSLYKGAKEELKEFYKNLKWDLNRRFN